MGDFIGSDNVEVITNADGSIYEQTTHPDGHVERRLIRPPCYSPYSPYIHSPYGEAVPIIPESAAYTHYTGTGTATASSITFRDYNELKKYFESEEERSVNIVRKESHKSGEHIVACCDEKDLSIENILKTLSAIKGKLMIDVAPIHIKTIECSITPQVRQNIVTASKKLKMYGKKRPIIARFDEYGNRLPDEIDLGTSQGITLKIIDPEKYGIFYFELKGIEFPRIEPTFEFEPSFIDKDDLPF